MALLHKEQRNAEDSPLPKAELKVSKPTADRPTDKPFKYIFVCASVGDCKCFHYSSETGKVTDITHGNRTHINDPKVAPPDLNKIRPDSF